MGRISVGDLGQNYSGGNKPRVMFCPRRVPFGVPVATGSVGEKLSFVPRHRVPAVAHSDTEGLTFGRQQDQVGTTFNRVISMSSSVLSRNASGSSSVILPLTAC